MNPKWERALDKARELRTMFVHSWDAEHQWHLVKSPMSGKTYTLFKFQYQVAYRKDFWWEWGCTCPAQDSQLPICYHKAFLFLALQEGELGEVA